MRHGQLQNAGDLLHMAGEGGQALFDALLIADVHEEFVEHGRPRCAHRRDEEAALCHRAQQTGRFQGDGLTAGVGAGDDERIILFAQRNVHRHTLFWVDERVTRPDQRKERIVRTVGLNAFISSARRAFASRTSISSMAL